MSAKHAQRAEPSPEFVEVAGELIVALSAILRRTRQSLGDLTPSQLSALTTIDESGTLRLGELAAREGVAPPTMSRVVDALLSKGLVERTRDPDDARSALLTVSESGRRNLHHTVGSRADLLAAHLAGLDAASADAIRRALPALRVLIERLQPER